MCTSPNRSSVRVSARALVNASIAFVAALVVLSIALITMPVRFVRSRPHIRARAGSTRHVDIQIYLEDRRCATELRRTLDHALQRSARTWHPLPLPINRVVVGVGFPAAGKIDLYERFPRTATGRDDAENGTQLRPFVVVTLGLRHGDRDLEPIEVAASLAAQIEAVVADQYARRSITATTTASRAPTSMSVGASQAVLASTDPAPKPSSPKRNGNSAAVDPRATITLDEAEAEPTSFGDKPRLAQLTNGQSHQ
jgi:hypothetical protein